MMTDGHGIEDYVVGTVDEFPEGSRRIVDVGGRLVGVFASNGKFFAVQNLCPHALAPICINDLSGTTLPSSPGEYVYGLEGLVLRCPWHGWEFDVRTGEALFGTDRRRLAVFAVRAEANKVIVSMRRRTGVAEGSSDRTAVNDGPATAPVSAT